MKGLQAQGCITACFMYDVLSIIHNPTFMMNNSIWL